MALVQGRAALDLVGFPYSHEQAFHDVAKDQKCVVLSREVGKTCTQLIEQGYDTKGYRIHAKSCDWGPMAGFVCRDPRLNKYGMAKADYNARQHDDALRGLMEGRAGVAPWRASTIPLKILPNRLAWLTKEGIIGSGNQQLVMRSEGSSWWYEGVAIHASGIRFHYVLWPEDLQGERVFGVYLDNEKNQNCFRQIGGVLYPATGQPPPREPLLAMVNPFSAYNPVVFRSAVTGDYDLFAVWPRRVDYDPMGEDRRLTGAGPSEWEITTNQQGQEKLKDRANEQILRYEDQQVGNITNRVYLVAQLLNSLFPPVPRHGQRNMVHHSDEGGRPFVNEVDLPLIAFVPMSDGGPVVSLGISDIEDMREVARRCGGRYQIILNKGWEGQLGHLGVVPQRQQPLPGYQWGNRWQQ